MGDNTAALLIVIDAVGLSTLEYLLDTCKRDIAVPNLARLGLGDIVRKDLAPRIGAGRKASYAARIAQASASADSVVGHREMTGIIDPRTFNLFPGGFSPAFIAELEKRINRKTMFNKMAGGLEAIEKNAAEHAKTGRPIVYASKCDPLIQIAMDEAVIAVPEQHHIADTAFELAREMGIPLTRSIARAYVRSADGEIVRTANRHDAVLPLEGRTLVDILYGRNVATVAVGKSSELVNTAYHAKIKISSKIFVNPDIGFRYVHPKGKDTNPFSAQGVINALEIAKTVYRPCGTFIFANFVDTDSLYGHTRDAAGTLACLEELDRYIPMFESRMSRGDLLVITADHGMAHKSDYGYHNNEPLALLAERMGCGADLGGLKPGKGKTLADAGYLVSQLFGCEKEFLSLKDLKDLIA